MNFKIIIIITSLFIFSSISANGESAVEVRIMEAIENNLSADIKVPATIVSTNDSEISSEVSGRILWIAEVGTTVIKGDQIARVNHRLLEIAVTKSKAELLRLQADYKFRIKEVKRIEKLVIQKTSPKRLLEQMITTRDMLEQDLKIQITELDKAEYYLENTVIKAPFDGIIVSRLNQMGKYVSKGDPLIRLVNTQSTEIITQVAMRLLEHLHNGMELNILSESVNQIGTVRAIIPVGNASSRMVEVRIKTEKSLWPIGMAVKVAVPISKRNNSVVVSRDSTILRNNSTYLFKLTEQNIAVKVPVTIGASKGSNIEVTGDLTAGDRIVIRGGERLNDGQEVIIGSTT